MRSDCKFIYTGIIVGTALWMCPSLASAQSKVDPKSNFKFELGVGASYNSNVSVTELDNNSGANDSQASLYGLIRYDKDFGENTEFYVRYRYSQTNHSKFSRFDRQTHSLASRIVHDFGSFDAGINYSYYDAALDNDGFLSAHRFSPYIRKRFNKKVMARAFYAYSDKNFDTSIARDAHENEGGVDIYYFIDSVRQYIQTQYSYKDVNSFGPQFDYGAHKVRVRYSKRIPLNGKRLRVRGTYRFEQRNYDSVTPSILAVRDDTKHRFIVEVQYPITDKVFGELEYLHAVNNSNLPAVDYNRDLLTATISVKF
ncbi:MAG: hypothetical protein L3J65_06030 [Robiginitomaculum sp.]|nr:hypothetical protein [Robiginitomaculum sp.]